MLARYRPKFTVKYLNRRMSARGSVNKRFDPNRVMTDSTYLLKSQIGVYSFTAPHGLNITC